MNKNLNIILLIFCFISVQVSGQVKSDYGIFFSENGVRYKNQKKPFINFLQTESENDKDTLFLRLDVQKEKETIITGEYKVTSIKKKKDNFYVHKNRLKKKTLYLIDIENANTNIRSPMYIRILSFEENIKNHQKIAVGKTYKFKLSHLVGIDYSIPEIVDGQEIYTVRSNPRRMESCFYKGIFISKFYYVGNYNVETPNLKGLYYIPHEEVNSNLK